MFERVHNPSNDKWEIKLMNQNDLPEGSSTARVTSHDLFGEVSGERRIKSNCLNNMTKFSVACLKRRFGEWNIDFLSDTPFIP